MKHPLNLSWKTEFPSIILLLIAGVASVYFYQRFPEVVTTHWNIAGEPDGYSSKAFAAFFFPALNVGIYLLFLAIPLLDPKKDRYQEFTKAFHIFKNLIVLTLTLIYAIVGLSALGYPIRVNQAIPGLVGLLLMILGNYMGKLKRNWFMGIRTPWTLSSDEVWEKTHRLGGKMFVVAGALMILTLTLPPQITWYVLIGIIPIIVIIPIIYSLVLYLKLKK